MAQLGSVILLALVSSATIIALLVTVTLLFPGLSSRAANIQGTMPGRSFFLGGVNFLFFFTVAAVLAQIGEQFPGGLGSLFGLAALTLVLLILSIMTIGLSGMVNLLADRTSAQPVTTGRKLGAATLLVAAGFAPVIGWFILTPIVLLTSLGAGIIAIIQGFGSGSSQPGSAI
jgi:hypothetical protein